jgi:hypothetical protein
MRAVPPKIVFRQRELITSAALSTLPKNGVIYYMGSWKSANFPWFIAHGSVAAKVDFDKHVAEIVLKYEGIFRKGTVTKIVTKMIPEGGQIKFINENKETDYIRFTAQTITSQHATGKYTHKSPSDAGTFEMKSISQQLFTQFIK